MSEITLSDFVGYVFSEMVRARGIADSESKRVAMIYADDPIMKHFSVPRFKIPEMELTIPVLISGARFSTAYSFVLEKEQFISFVKGKLDNVIKSIMLKGRNINVFLDGTTPLRPISPIRTTDAGSSLLVSPAPSRQAASPRKTASAKGSNSNESIVEFFMQLKNNLDASKPENIIQDQWFVIFWQKIQETQLQEQYKQHYPANDLFRQGLAEITAWVKQNTIVSQTKIENLLVNPETNSVKTESTEASVFTVKAKIIEEGIFIRSVRDEATGKTEYITEFE